MSELTITKHNPAITAAIRDLKEQLKTIAVEQKEAKQVFRKEMSEWFKGQRSCPSSGVEDGAYITSLHILYQKLRQTKRPHLDEAKWANDEGVGLNRRTVYRRTCKQLIEKHPILNPETPNEDSAVAEVVALLQEDLA